MKSIIVFVACAMLLAVTAVADPWLGDVQTLAADPDHQYGPVVAYNSVHNEYLVVWFIAVSSVDRVFGVRVDSQGLPIGSSFAISEPGNAQWDPDVAYDPVNDRYLVIWTFDYSGDGSDTDVLGRFIPSSGPSPNEPVFAIEEALSNQQSSALAYNPDTLEFLIVWQDNEELGPYSIFGRRLAADGASASSIFDVVNGPLDYLGPRVVWNEETQQYLVVYEQFPDGSGRDIYGTRLAADGGAIAPAIGIAGLPGSEWSPNVATCRGEYMVVWIAALGTGRDPDSEAYARAVSGDGAVGTIVTDLPGNYLNEDAPSEVWHSTR